MSSKKRVNKTFEESCRIEHLFIDQNDGTHWCLSKETPKSRKFDKTVCKLVSCPNYISKEIESLSKKEKKIRGYIEKGKSIDFIMEKSPCSRAWYFRVKKRMEEDKKRLEIEQIELDEESKAYQKIEEPVKNIHTKKPLSVSVQKTRVQARNPVYPQKKSPIKLKLNSIKHYQTAIRHALDNSYRWIPYNIQEIKTYMKDKELKLNPVTIEVISTKQVYIRAEILMREYHDRPDKAKELYDILSIEWKKPACSIWIERRLHLWEVSHALAGLKKAELTTKEWYEKMEIDFPPSLDPEANDFITNRSDLERSGIFGALEYEIKKELGIDDELENYYHTTEKFNPVDIFHIKNLIRENPNHHYSVPLKEKIQDYARAKG